MAQLIELPDDVLLEIFKLFSCKYLFNLVTTNRHLYELSSNPELLGKLTQRRYGFCLKKITWYDYTNLEHLSNEAKSITLDAPYHRSDESHMHEMYLMTTLRGFSGFTDNFCRFFKRAVSTESPEVLQYLLLIVVDSSKLFEIYSRIQHTALPSKIKSFMELYPTMFGMIEISD